MTAYFFVRKNLLMVLACLVFLVGIGLRTWAARTYPLWLDEWATLIFADQPFSRLWGIWMARETNPPLYYTLVKFLMLAGAHSPLTLRLFSLIASIAEMALVWFYCRQKFGKTEALFGLALVAFSQATVAMSVELRSYQYVLDLIFIAFWALENWARSQNRGALAIYVAAAALATYMHSTALIDLFALNLTIILVYWRSFNAKSWIQLLIANVAVAIFSAWEMYLIYLQLRSPLIMNNIGWIKPKSIFSVLKESAHLGGLLLYFKVTSDHILDIILSASLLILTGSYLFFSRILNKWHPVKNIDNIIIFIAITFCAYAIVNQFHPIFEAEKVLYFLTPFAAILLAAIPGASISPIIRALLPSACVVALMFNMALRWGGLGFAEDWGSLLSIPRDQRSVLLVPTSAAGSMVQWFCKLDMRLSSCPFSVLPVTSDEGMHAWAIKGWGSPPMNKSQAAQRIAQGAPGTVVYSLVVYNQDALDQFGWKSAIHTESLNLVYLRGPYARDVFARK